MYMAYSNNPHLPRVRMDAVRLVRSEVADRLRNFLGAEFDFETGDGKPAPEYQAEVLWLD
jgi:hypothetical protein